MNILYDLGDTVRDCWHSTAQWIIAQSVQFGCQDHMAGAVMPMDQVKVAPHEPSRDVVLEDLRGETISITTLDNVKLDAVWADRANKSGPTAIIFHGNGCTLNAMSGQAEWYLNRGINVLLITMRGYPGSEGSCTKSGELGCYLDAEAAVRYVEQTKGIARDQIIAHGYSLGGALAAACGYFFGTYVTLDHAFTRPGAVAVGIADRIAETATNALPGPLEIVAPDFLGEGLMQGAFPSGIIYEIPAEKQLPGSKPLVTDGLNNLEKVKKMDKDFFVIFGSDDDLMPNRFADEFYEAKFGPVPPETDREGRQVYQQEKANHIAKLPGGHWGVFGYDNNASIKYREFLCSIGLLKNNRLI